MNRRFCPIHAQQKVTQGLIGLFVDQIDLSGVELIS